MALAATSLMMTTIWTSETTADGVARFLLILSIFYDDYRVPLVKKITEREKLGIDLMKTHILMVGL